MRRSTNKEMVADMVAINIDGKLDHFINRAKNNYYHDYKQPEDVICGKTLFVSESAREPLLKEIRQRVIDGYYDEEADEEDKADMRKDLPPSMWGLLGLNPSN